MKNEGFGTNPVEQIPYPSQKKRIRIRKNWLYALKRLPTWEWFQIVGDLLWYPVVQPDTMQPLIPDTNEHDELIRYLKKNLSSKTFKTEMKLKLKFKELQTKKKPVQHKCVQHENNSFWELLT